MKSTLTAALLVLASGAALTLALPSAAAPAQPPFSKDVPAARPASRQAPVPAPRRDTPDDGVRFLLKIQNEVRPDGSLAATVTNISGASLFFTGYGPKHPQCSVEELREGRWVRISYHWCGTGLEQQEIKPGESRTLSVFGPHADKETKKRAWTVFTNKSDFVNRTKPDFNGTKSDFLSHDLLDKRKSDERTRTILLGEVGREPVPAP